MPIPSPTYLLQNIYDELEGAQRCCRIPSVFDNMQHSEDACDSTQLRKNPALLHLNLGCALARRSPHPSLRLVPS